MKQLVNISAILLIICSWFACNPDEEPPVPVPPDPPQPYVDEALLDEWRLKRFLDLDDSVLHWYPIGMERDIVLRFEEDSLLTGEVISFDLFDCLYDVNKGFNRLNFHDFDYPEFEHKCCQWDKWFLEVMFDNRNNISYQAEDDNQLKFFYEDSTKYMLFYSAKKPDENAAQFDILEKAWKVEWYQDTLGNMIAQKPADEEGDIYFVFKHNHQLEGHYITYSFDDGFYRADESGYMLVSVPLNPVPNLCCEWDVICINVLRHKKVNRFKYDGGKYLYLYYDEASKIMVLSN